MVLLRISIYKILRLLARAIITTVLILAFICPMPALAATNTATDAGGGDITLLPSGPVTVTSVQPLLVKEARDLTGAIIPNGSNVSSGQTIYFVIYIDNTTSVSASNFRITDLINEAEFTYIPDSMELATVVTGSSGAAIWGGLWTSLSDIVGVPDDVASITDSGGPAGLDKVTIGAVPGQANQILTVPALSLRAIRFRVTVN